VESRYEGVPHGLPKKPNWNVAPDILQWWDDIWENSCITDDERKALLAKMSVADEKAFQVPTFPKSLTNANKFVKSREAGLYNVAVKMMFGLRPALFAFEALASEMVTAGLNSDLRDRLREIRNTLSTNIVSTVDAVSYVNTLRRNNALEAIDQNVRSHFGKLSSTREYLFGVPFKGAYKNAAEDAKILVKPKQTPFRGPPAGKKPFPAGKKKGQGKKKKPQPEEKKFAGAS